MSDPEPPFVRILTTSTPRNEGGVRQGGIVGAEQPPTGHCDLDGGIPRQKTERPVGASMGLEEMLGADRTNGNYRNWGPLVSCILQDCR